MSRIVHLWRDYDQEQITQNTISIIIMRKINTRTILKHFVYLIAIKYQYINKNYESISNPIVILIKSGCKPKYHEIRNRVRCIIVNSSIVVTSLNEIM